MRLAQLVFGGINTREYYRRVPTEDKGGWSLAQTRCFRQLDLAPFDLLFWPHPLVIHHHRGAVGERTDRSQEQERAESRDERLDALSLVRR